MRGATGHGPRVSVWTGEGRADSAVCDRCSLCVRVPVKRATLCACAPSGAGVANKRSPDALHLNLWMLFTFDSSQAGARQVSDWCL